jgi:hypothetical protein
MRTPAAPVPTLPSSAGFALAVVLVRPAGPARIVGTAQSGTLRRPVSGGHTRRLREALLARLGVKTTGSLHTGVPS